MGEYSLKFFAWEKLGTWVGADPNWCMDDDEKLPAEDWFDNSIDTSIPSDIIGMPWRSEKGWPKASQSFSTSAYIKVRLKKQRYLVTRETIYIKYWKLSLIQIFWSSN